MSYIGNGITIFKSGGAPASTLLNGLIHYWKLNEPSGNTSYDSCTPAQNGTPLNTTPNATGQINKAYLFVRASLSEINFGAIALTVRTISFWAKLAIINPYNILYNDWNTHGGTWVKSDGNIIQLGQTGGVLATWATTWTDITTFHHICVINSVIGTSGSIELYFDGISQGVKSIVTYNMDKLYAGLNIGGSAHQLDGYLDDIKLWNRILTPTEVIEDHTRGLSGLPLF